MPLRHSDGTVDRIMYTSLNITQIKELEQQVITALEENKKLLKSERQAKQEVESAKRDLEKMVLKRTEELSRSNEQLVRINQELNQSSTLLLMI